MELESKKCIPCEAGSKPLDAEEIQKYLNNLEMPWDLQNNAKISFEFAFKSFKEAIKFVNQAAEIAEKEGHHPDIHIAYNKIRIELWTHAVNGLSENDFILARKLELNFKKQINN